MARFLLLGRADGGEAAQHEIGYIVDILPDSHQFGIREDKRVWEAAGSPDPPWDDFFLVIDIPDLPAERVRHRVDQKHTRPAVEGDPEFEAHDPEDRIVLLNRRRFRASLSRLPNGPRNRLFREGFLVLDNFQRGDWNDVIIDRTPNDEPFDPGA